MAIRKVHGNNDNILNLRDHEKNKILILLVIGLSLGSCVQTDDEAFSPEPAVKGGENPLRPFVLLLLQHARLLMHP